MDISSEEKWLRDALRAEPEWLRASVLKNFGYYATDEEREVAWAAAQRREQEEVIRSECRGMFEQYQRGDISRETGYEHCQMAIKQRAPWLSLKLFAFRCWFCGAENPFGTPKKYCFLCAAPQRLHWLCSMESHLWKTCYDSGKYHYQECPRCHKRRFIEVSRSGYEPIHHVWLEGGAWEQPLPVFRGMQSAVMPATPADPKFGNGFVIIP